MSRRLPEDEREQIRQAARESVDRMMVNSEELKRNIREAIHAADKERVS